MLDDVVFILAGTQAAYWCVVGWLARQHFRGAARDWGGFRPSVSVLKPLKGVEPGAFERFATFCRQDYPDYALLFGVADPGDPAIEEVRRLQRAFPMCDIQLFIGQASGVNPKVNILRHLAKQARGQVLVVSDCDVQAAPDHLKRLVQPLADAKVGMVICPYAVQGARSLPDRLEALRLNTEFIPSVVLAQTVGVAVGTGATMAVSRAALDAVGGFAAFSDDLLEDQKLALRLLETGHRIELLHDVVGLSAPGITLAESWRREIRWSRGIRTTGRLRYLGVAITFFFPLLILAILAGSSLVWGIVAGLLAVRILLALPVARRLGASLAPADICLLPLRDAMSFTVWCVGLVGWQVMWRGNRYYLDGEGHISHNPPPRWHLGEALGGAVRRLDAYLRAREHIFEFSESPECMLRAQRVLARKPMRLAHGVRIRAGDPLGELHLWNEHIARMSAAGPQLRWSLRTQRVLAATLRQLARAAATDPRLRDVKAFRGSSAISHRAGAEQVRRFFDRLGFELRPPPRRGSVLRRIHDFFENILIWLLTWTFNREALRGKPFMRARMELWMSREVLLTKYGGKAGRVAEKAGARGEPRMADPVAERARGDGA